MGVANLGRAEVCSDRSYVNKHLTGMFRVMGVWHETSAQYTPQKNGSAGHLNCTLEDDMRVMMAAVNGYPQLLLGEAMSMVSLQRNISATAGSTFTPWGRFTGKKPDVAHMCEFGYVIP